MVKSTIFFNKLNSVYFCYKKKKKRRRNRGGWVRIWCVQDYINKKSLRVTLLHLQSYYAERERERYEENENTKQFVV